ncbi:NAD(+)/NADH kinase [Actinoplanes subtropicus]|uniref:NAD(+)/NADH kinase n=1 Tax=Actinoplanes subtropicus TaxID=543632 RepID=UPI0004C3C841|nr:NAD(+)/NADH kinase [Actinoplanes subtropicus]
MDAIGLVLHPTKLVDKSVDTVLAFARAGSLRVLARDTDRDRVPDGVELLPEARFAAEVGAIIALGGDGTMLGALRMTVGRPVPVLGVNHGHLGFLVEVTPAELPGALAKVAAGEFTIEHHSCLEVGQLPVKYGFNDVVLGRAGRSGTVSVDLTVNGQRYGYYRGDAVVVATPTGSTAYNYAAGGPVLSPSSRAMVVTPVAPMSGISRPVVLGASDRVTLTVAAESAPIAVEVDGTPAGDLERGDRLTTTMRPDAAQVVRLSATDHANRSRIKLSLLDLPLRRDQLLELIPAALRRNPD